ncbi:MAG: GYDIA family GHMP kinase [Bacteroidota bacterium]
MEQSFYSNGKLLLTGEYAILDGATGLAVPSQFGQSLHVKATSSKILDWKSFDADNSVWFQAQFSIQKLEALSSSDANTSNTLKQILEVTLGMNRDFPLGNSGWQVESHLTFPRNWGLGTSSTLINNIAQWAGIDPYGLLKNTFGGSGYDIACAQNNKPLLYRLQDGGPQIEIVDFAPPFKDSLFFVYLNEKRNSREAIAKYRTLQFNGEALLDGISSITEKVLVSSDLFEFEMLLNEHEQLLSEVLRVPTVKSKLFPDYPGTIKSLGAWGGDFILATGKAEDMDYFNKKGYTVQVPFSKMVR